MNKRLSFIKALRGACQGLDSEIICLEYYAIPMIRGLDDLSLESIRRSESGDLDSKAVDQIDLDAMTDHGSYVWKR